MVPRNLRSFSLAALLGCALLFAQAAILFHELDPATWDADHACETCVAASILGGANTAAFHAFQFPLPDHSIEPAATRVFSSRALPQAVARGPPAVS